MAVTRPSGRTVRAHEAWWLADQSIIKVRDLNVPAQKEPDTAPVPDPTAGLTFNLRLTAEQREQRGRVVVPYARGGVTYATLLASMQPDKPDSDEESEMV